jgi:hypothetical protein
VEIKSHFALLGTAALLLCCGPVTATPCTGVNVGTSMTSDVTLNAIASTQCEIVDGNSGAPQNTPGTAPIPTDGAFAGGPWTQGAFSSFFSAGHNGTWSWNGGPGGFDVMFSLHAGGDSGFFIFTDIFLPANATSAGTWLIDWVNNGNQHPDFSNAQVWYRADTDVIRITVPEPSSLALIGLGLLGLVGVFRQRNG